MKVAVILGSPRRASNSSLLAEVITEIARKNGAEIMTHALNALRFRGCQACSACKGKSERCILKDDLGVVLEDVIDANVIILAFPVYWGELSGQMKLFLDRTYSYLKPGFMEREDKHRLPPGKTLIWIQAQGADSDEMYSDIFPRYNTFFKQLDYFRRSYVIVAHGVNVPGAVINRPDLLDRARQIGESVFS